MRVFIYNTKCRLNILKNVEKKYFVKKNIFRLKQNILLNKNIDYLN